MALAIIPTCYYCYFFATFFCFLFVFFFHLSLSSFSTSWRYAFDRFNEKDLRWQTVLKIIIFYFSLRSPFAFVYRSAFFNYICTDFMAAFSVLTSVHTKLKPLQRLGADLEAAQVAQTEFLQ